MSGSTINSVFLTALQVPHTSAYSDRRFRTMTFKTLFGFSKLLDEYGIRNEVLRLSDRSSITRLTSPFIAETDKGFVLVSGIGQDSVTYRYGEDGQTEATASTDAFLKACTGIVLLAYPSPQSQEPDYDKHHVFEKASKAKPRILIALIAFLFLYLFISGGLWRHAWSTMLTVINCAGIYISYLLLLKQLHIHSPYAERICSVIEKGGCDTVLSTKASKFFGLFGWSEVGFAYFSVSLVALLVFPGHTAPLAIINACCLPFSIWSVWYQKVRAKAWCTLCLCVQSLLWLSFFCYLWGRSFHGYDSFGNIAVLGACYTVMLLGVNRLLPLFDRSPDEERESPEDQISQ